MFIFIEHQSSAADEFLRRIKQIALESGTIKLKIRPTIAMISVWTTKIPNLNVSPAVYICKTMMLMRSACCWETSACYCGVPFSLWSSRITHAAVHETAGRVQQREGPCCHVSTDLFFFFHFFFYYWPHLALYYSFSGGHIRQSNSPLYSLTTITIHFSFYSKAHSSWAACAVITPTAAERESTAV